MYEWRAEAPRNTPAACTGRGSFEIVHDEQRVDRNAPGPTLAPGLVLGVADDLDEGEDRLPARRVTDGQVASLQEARPRVESGRGCEAGSTRPGRER